MKPGLTAGMQQTTRVVVDTERTIGFMGDALRVYATPMMVRDIEMTCKDFLGEYLSTEENSVGARVEIDHLGPTLLNMWVDVTATVTGTLLYRPLPVALSRERGWPAKDYVIASATQNLPLL